MRFSRSVFFVFGALVISTSWSYAVDYWPMEPGVKTLYVNDSGTIRERCFSDVGQCVLTYPDYPACTRWEGYSLGEEGNVLYHGATSYCTGALDPSVMFNYAPPITLLDFPLEVGKYWLCETDYSGYGYKSAESAHIVYCEVESEEEITVPGGTYNVVVVLVNDIIGVAWQRYYLERDLGPLVLPGGYEFLRVENIVGTDQASWDGVKALFR